MEIEKFPEFCLAVSAENLAQKKSGEAHQTPKHVVMAYILSSVEKQNAKNRQHSPSCEAMRGETLINYVKSALLHFANSVYVVKKVCTFDEDGTVKQVREYQIPEGHSLYPVKK